MDLISTYFPEVNSLTPDQIQAARKKAAVYLAQLRPDLDTRPNSPFGDWLLDPFAELMAAAEVALGRVQSDLVLENVARGTIWNCDFVREYLKNFAIVERETLQASGVIRISFNTDQAYELDRSIAFTFGSSTDIFNLRLPHIGGMSIYPVGRQLPANINARSLVEIAPGEYAVDLPVVGTMTTQISEGATGATDQAEDEMVSISAVADFSFGLPPDSLSTLAKKARETVYSSSFNTGAGAFRFLAKEFPDLAGISAVLSGDYEMTRDSFNILGVAEGKVDLYVKSNANYLAQTQIIRLEYDATNEKYIGVWDATSIPVVVDAVVSTDDETISFVNRWQVITQSTDPVKAPMANAGFSVYEKRWLVVDAPRDPDNGEALLVPEVDADGSFNYFRIDYRTDTMIRVVSDTVSARDNCPVGVDVLVRGFNVLDVRTLTVTYTRSRGVTVNTENAREEIWKYFNSLGYPNVFSESRIVDAMYYAGAQDTVAIECDATICWGGGTIILPPGGTDPSDDYATAITECLQPRRILIHSSRGMLPVYKDVNLGDADETMEAINYRNIAYHLDRNNISFREIVR